MAYHDFVMVCREPSSEVKIRAKPQPWTRPLLHPWEVYSCDIHPAHFVTRVVPCYLTCTFVLFLVEEVLLYFC